MRKFDLATLCLRTWSGTLIAFLAFNTSHFFFGLSHSESMSHLFGTLVFSAILLFLLKQNKEKDRENDHASRSFLNTVFDNIPNMVFVKEAKDLRFVRVNRASEEIIGYPPETYLGKNVYDIFPKEQADFFTEKDRLVIENRSVLDIPEEPVSTRQGIRILHTKKIPVFDKKGNPQYLLGISEDITEKKATEIAKTNLLREQAARLEAEKSAEQLRFFDHASSALGTSLDIDLMLSDFSKVILSRMANVVRIDLIQNHAGEKTTLFPKGAEVPPLFAQLAMTTLANGKSERGVDGGATILSVPIRSHSTLFGALTLLSRRENFIYTEYDLSLVKDLGKRAGIAIENALLFLKVQEANRAKSAFLANMSHEIRTPLGAMLGFAELVSDAKGLQGEQLEHVNTILRNGHQLLRIVDEILDLSKVESEHLEVERISFPLPKLLKDVLSLLDVRAKEKGLDLKLQIEAELPETIVTDPTRLRQILLNVIGNAIKFTPTGEVTVSVRTRASSTGLPLLEIAVQDSGIGISEEQRARLFQPFTQADDSTTRKFGGTGLGLFLSQKFARLLGGDLELAESKLGVGSRFLVTIAIPNEASPSSRPEPNAVATLPAFLSATRSGSCQKKRLLIVDDSEDHRLLIRHHLERMGFSLEVDFAENGREGAERALAAPYDLILMDIQMPDMDGFKAVKALRDNALPTPIIALTAHAMKGYREKCIDAGFSDYLCKPIHKETLVGLLMKYGMNPKVGFEESVEGSEAAEANADSEVSP